MEHTVDGYHTLSDGRRLYWRVDDFTDPWKQRADCPPDPRFCRDRRSLARLGATSRTRLPGASHRPARLRQVRSDAGGFPLVARHHGGRHRLVHRSPCARGRTRHRLQDRDPAEHPPRRAAARSREEPRSLRGAGHGAERRSLGPPDRRTRRKGLGGYRPWMRGWERRCRRSRKPGGPSSWARPTNRPCSAFCATWRRSTSAPKSAAIRCPTLVVATDSAYRPLSQVTPWQSRIPNSRLATIPGGGFHPAAVAPDLCAETALAFLREVDRSSPSAIQSATEAA